MGNIHYGAYPPPKFKKGRRKKKKDSIIPYSKLPAGVRRADENACRKIGEKD